MNPRSLQAPRSGSADRADVSDAGRAQAPGKRSRAGEAEPTAPPAFAARAGARASGAGAGGRVADWAMDDGLRAAMGLGPDGGNDGDGGDGGDGKAGAEADISGGLPGPIRAEMERVFGEKFDDVRIHEGPQAAAVGAVAYTRGSDIFFQPGRFDPSSLAGKELLAHELTHVVQQRAGRVAAEAGPLGKDLAMNRDPALEAEADAAGARAARGQPAAVSRAGSGGAAATIQRYADVQLDGSDWKQSDGNKLLTRDAASHELYAEPQTIATGEAALAAAGSFITLAGAAQVPGGQPGQRVAQLGLQRVTASYRPRGAQANSAQTPAAHKGKAIGPGLREPGLAELNNNGAAPLVTPSQCIDAARVVMGVTGGHLARDLEMPVGNVDGANHVYARQPGADFEDADFQNQKHAPSSTENGALTALSRQLLDFLDSRALRTLAEQEQAKTEVARFRVQAQQLQEDNPSKAWVVLHAIKRDLPAVYREFTRFAGIDAAAAPEVGEALVTYIAETKAGRAFKTNQRLYQALVQRLTQPVVAQLGIDADTPVPRIQEIIKAAEAQQHPHHQHHDALAEVSDAHNMWNMHWAGVILKDGTDYATLENDASTKEPSRQSGQDAAATATGGDVNASWRYQLYGTSQPGQSFHEHMMEGGDFGDFASTTRFRRQAAGEALVGKTEHRVYALRMPAGQDPALAAQMRWELYSHDAAAAAGASPAEFAAVLTVQPIKGSPQVRITDVTMLARDLPPRVGGAIEEALELIDVWRLRAPGPPLVSMDALRERLRVFQHAVTYLLSLGPAARPVDRYVSVVSRNARKLELDAEIRPRFEAFRAYASSVEDRRTPSTIDGMSIGLIFQMLQLLDTDLLWSYERDEPDAFTATRLASYRTALDRQRREARHFEARLDEARQALPVLDRADALMLELERVYRRLFPAR